MSLKKFQFIQDDLKNLFQKSDSKSLLALKDKNIFITGCSGFVGIWLCEVLNYLNTTLNYNINVYGIDIQLERIKTEAPHLLNIKSFVFKKEDVRYLTEIPKNINYVIHAAGIPDHRFHTTNPVDVLTTTANGTENILKAADRLSELLMFVNLSSALVYGNFESRTEPINETEALVLKSNSPYVSAKIYSESMTQSYRQQYRTPAIIIRPFTVTGPFQSLSSPWALNNFIQDAISGVAIKVLGTGQTTRSFLYGTDVAFWLLKMTVDGKSGEIFNLGNSEPVDLKTAANYVNQSFTQTKEIVFCTGNSSHHKINFMVPDNSLVTSKFRLLPTYTTAEAIGRSVEWYRLEKNQVLSD